MRALDKRDLFKGVLTKNGYDIEVYGNTYRATKFFSERVLTSKIVLEYNLKLKKLINKNVHIYESSSNFENQDQIDQLQIVFNIMNKDIKDIEKDFQKYDLSM